MKTHLCLENRPQDSRVRINKDDVVQTLDARMGMGGGNVPLIMSIESHPQDSRYEIKDPEISQTLSSNMCHDSSNGGLVMETQNSIVRRLTPTECSLLQGFPPDWCDIGDWTDSKGKVHKDSDSPKYKALGNSICLPFWSWMSGRMVEQLKKSGVEHPTMASLFDGISGFPLVYARHGCTPVWTSEIEEYPIAVCKKHFGDEQTGEVGDLEKYLYSVAPLEQRRMKPTDIWTNHPNPEFIPPCKNGDKCHAPAPRGSKTGTQGMKNAKERSVIPPLLCKHIVEICEGKFDHQIIANPQTLPLFDLGNSNG